MRVRRLRDRINHVGYRKGQRVDQIRERNQVASYVGRQPPANAAHYGIYDS